MPPSSSSRRPTAPTRRAARCGTSAPIVGMPRAVVITQLDARDADFAATLADCQAHFGAGIQPLGVPVPGSAGAVSSIADLLLGEVHDYAGGTRTVRPAGPEHAELFDTYRPALIEGIIEESEDGGLMDRYLEGEELDFETLEKDLLTAVAHGTFHPVLPLSAETGAGVGVLLHLIEAAFPHPGLHPLPTVTPGGRRRRRSRSAPTPTARSSPRSCTPESDAYVGPPLARAGVLRHAAPRPGRARVGSPRAARRADRRGPRRPRRRRAPRRRRRPARRRPAAQDRGDRRRGRRRHQARHRADLRHAVLPRRPAARHAVGAARGAAPRRGRGRDPRRRGPDAGRLPRARRRGPVAAHRARRRHRPGRAVDHRPGPPRARARPAALALQRRRRAGAGAGGDEGDRGHPRRGPGPARQAVGWSRPVRRVPPGHGAAPPRRRASSSTRSSSAARCRASSSAASRRACTTSSSGGCSPAGRSSTSRSPSPTARRTRSTPPTSPSRPPRGWPCASSPRRRRCACSSRSTP